MLLFFVINTATAQTEMELINDMLLVAENFATPGAEGAALQASAGWFTSGQTLEKWKVEVSVHGNGLFIPSSKQTKRASNSDFSVLNIQGDDNVLLPTVFGGDTDVMYEGRILGQAFSFDAIDGLDRGVILHPYPQVTVGLPYSTEVAVRFMPSVMFNDVGVSTYGIGLKHNLTQYYERRYNAEDFQFAVVAAYSHFQVDYAFSRIEIPIFLQLNRIDVNADLWLFQALGSKLYDSFEVFGGLGITASSFSYEMGGSGTALPMLNETLTGIDGSGTLFKGDLGFNYYFGNFKISTMLTASKYFNANLGIHYRI